MSNVAWVSGFAFTFYSKRSKELPREFPKIVGYGCDGVLTAGVKEEVCLTHL